MNLNLYIAKKISKKEGAGKNGYLSRTSNIVVVLSISISILVMLLSIIITSGFKKEVAEKSSGFSGDFVFSYPGVEPTTDHHSISKNLSYMEDLLSIEGIQTISPVAYKPGMIKNDEEVHGLLFKGVDSNYVFDFFSKNLVAGRVPEFATQKMSSEILVSEKLADLMLYEVGDEISAYFVGENVRFRKFKIVGLYDISLEDVDEKLAVIDLRQVQRLNSMKPDQVSALEIYLDEQVSQSQKQSISDQIDLLIMDKSQDTDSPVVSRSVEDLYAQLFDWLGLLDYNVLVILVLMVAVAGFNMISGLLIILFEKISMIGLLKSLGMKSRDVSRIFVYRGLLIVIKGMLIGNALALVFYFIQKHLHLIKLNPESYFVDHVPVFLDLSTFLLFNLISLVVMLLVMLIPSAFISKISPDKTLRMN